ncbi:multi-sensor signal transduction histidine kinase [Geobacter metallireducens RCH3]|uniref:histidine kinase n=1 Tax=Geobacter metallireducens (strain ATCC 53774 / DSM 7210 / GS-15) TaxID=269799 RepID=Q39ZR3_GEOMG|nr:ATP-binding protein [Geobacter metallireducens]ABB30261.1 sensor histidine kinase of FgrL, PAS domain-containing [Geobacter metallireducens GS-15]EHP85576.1 multi-sensor signal transduction histidine kinase [Geobacter metallireducens RCH3]
MKLPYHTMPFRIAAYYALCAGLWILLSDRLLGVAVRDPDLITSLETAKGWLFVAVTALLLHVVVRRFVDEVMRREELLRERNEELCMVEEELRQQLDESERAQQELRESEENYRLLFSSNPHPMCVFDLETLAFLEVNGSAIQHYGYSREEFLAMTIKDIRPPEDVPSLMAIVKRVDSGPDRVGVWRHRKKDGTIISVEITSHMIDFAGRRAKVILCNDVTERIRAKEEILRLNAELEQRVRQRTAELEQANREMESFSYSVSHDLRAPLRHIDGFSRVLLEDCGDQLNQEGKGYLTRICAAANRMGQLIDDLLQLASVSRSELQRRPVDFSNLARTIALELKQTDPEREVTFTIAGGVSAQGDPVLLRVVLENLLGNAWKYTGKNHRTAIEFGAVEGEEGRVYFVRDNGVGFDMTYVGKLFTPFQRLHAMDEFEGTGIGLATVRRVVERHGGRAWAEGTIGAGATFYFTLGESHRLAEGDEG